MKGTTEHAEASERLILPYNPLTTEEEATSAYNASLSNKLQDRMSKVQADFDRRYCF